MHELSHLSDEALLENTRLCARSEREKTAALVAHLAEVYRRDLALKRGYSSLYRYARAALELSDAMAWERVTAARLSVEMPEAIERLSKGELTLASACELFKTIREVEKPQKAFEVPKAQAELLIPVTAPMAPVTLGAPESAVQSSKLLLTEKRELLTQILGKTKRESVQVLQGWKDERAGAVTVPKTQHERTFTLTDDELAQFDRLRDLLSHTLGTRDPQAVFLWLLKQGLEKADPVLREERAQARMRKAAARKPAEAPRKRESSKTEECAEQQALSEPLAHDAPLLAFKETLRNHPRKPLPASLKRRVWIRDQGRCQHADLKTGRKCGASAFLDYDHRIPLSRGGSDQESNIALSCASHNRRRPRWSEADQSG